MKKLIFLLIGMLFMLLSETVYADVGPAPPDNPVIGLYQPTQNVLSAVTPDPVMVMSCYPPGVTQLQQLSIIKAIVCRSITAYCNPDYGSYRLKLSELNNNTIGTNTFAYSMAIRSTTRHVSIPAIFI